jgi:hypothetical protein
MWVMVLALAAFLVAVIAPLEAFVGHSASRTELSVIQAGIAVVAVIGLVLGLSRMKRVYLRFAFK